MRGRDQPGTSSVRSRDRDASSHLSLVDFRSYAEVELALDAGVDGAGRAERAGQDQPGRGARLRRHARLAPGRHRRAAGPGRRRARGGPRRRSCTTAASCWSSWRSSRARPTGPGSTGRRCRGRARCSACCARCCSRRRTWRWSAATRASGAASSTTCWSRGTPRFAGVRADYDRVLKQRNALLKSAGAPASAPARGDLRTLDVWDAHLATAGAELLAGAARAGRRRCGRSSPRRTTRSAAGGGGGAGARAGLPQLAGRRTCRSSPDRRAAGRGAARRELARVRPQRGRARRLAGRAAPRRPRARARAGCRPRATPATASPGRSRWRCGWRRTTCCAPTAASRCWSSTTSSPSSTPAAATGWPSWSRGAEQVLVTAAVADDVPAALAGARFDVMGGEVRRVR